MPENKEENIPKRLESIAYLRTILEILNEESDRYVPKSEIKTKFLGRLNPNKELDDVALENSLNNTLSYAEGINDKVGRPKVDTAEYLANVAQIWQTKLIEMEKLPINGKQEDCYMIKIKGIEVLNQMQLNKNIINFQNSSDRSSRAIFILTIFLVALAAIQILLFIDSQPGLAMYSTPTEIILAFVMLGVIIVEKNVLFDSSNIKTTKNTDEKPKGNGIITFIIGSVITLALIILLWALFKFDNWSVATIRETIIGVIVAYSIFVYGLILKYLILPIQTKLFVKLGKGFMKDWKENDKKRRIVLVPIKVFLRVIPILIILLWVALDFASAGVSQAVTYEVLGGITGAWVLGIFFNDFGISSE